MGRGEVPPQRPPSRVDIPLLTLLLACAPPTDAERFAEARAAASFDAAWAACVPIVEEATRGDCQHEASTRFKAFGRCGEVPAGVWREECWFSAAEHLAQQKAWPEAVSACRSTSFVRNCETHVLDAFAMTQHERTVSDAAAALAPLVPLLDIAHVSHEFWYAYFRIRIDAGLPVEGEACADEFCDGGARRAIMRVVDKDKKKAADGPIPTYTWATSEWATRAVKTAWERPKERRPGGPPPGPPLAAGARPPTTASPPASPPTVEPPAQTE